MISRLTQAAPSAIRNGVSRSASLQTASRRTFMTTTFKRPSLSSYPRSPATTSAATTIKPDAGVVSSSGETLDLMPKISSHPSLAGTQVRCGPRNNMTGFTHLKRKRRIGFLARKRSKTGQHILKRRRIKGRVSLSH